MKINKLPFNISILNTNSQAFSQLTRVTSMDIFDGATKNFNPQGLFSIELFGKIGDELRNRTYAYIDLGVDIFHPIIHKALSDLKELYASIMRGSDYAIWDPKLKDFVKSNAIDGYTGYSFFMEHFHELAFDRRNSIKRDSNIDLVNKARNDKLATYSKRIVMPAGLRDFEVDKNGVQSQDEVNDFYRKLLASSNLVNPMAVKTSIKSLDPVRNTMQHTSNALHDYIIAMLEGKKKLVYDKWASRKIHDSTRNVITALIDDIEFNGDPKAVRSTDTVVGVYQYLKSIMPLTIYRVRTGILSQIFTSPTTPMFLVNKKTLKKDNVPVDPDLYDDWMTEEGLEKTLTKFGDENLRHLELGTKDHWFALVYNDGSKFMVIHDIAELPPEWEQKFLNPITFAELVYLSIADTTKDRYSYVTRYPITGFGSIYPSTIYLRSTTKSSTLEECGEGGEKTGRIYYNFPIRGEPFVNSMSPSTTTLGLLGADFDGDTCSLNTVLTEESNNEAKKLLGNRDYYVSISGKMNFSAANDTLNLVLKNMTGEPRDVNDL